MSDRVMWKRLALTLSSQLPDDAAIARLVLGYVNELQDLVHATGQPAVGNVVPIKRPPA